MIKKYVKYLVIKFLCLLPSNWIHFLSNAAKINLTVRVEDSVKFNHHISCAVDASNLGNYDDAEQHLYQAATIGTHSREVAPHLGRVRFLKQRFSSVATQSEISNMHETIRLMELEINSRPIYVPSEFWNTFGKFHIQLLEQYGIENFKRTVSHNYQNWFMVSNNDPQVAKLLETWPSNYSCEPWFNTIEVPDHVGLHPSLSFNDPTYPLAFLEQREIYRVSVGLLWEYVRKIDEFHILDQSTESEVGNPIRVWRKGQLISSDLAHSVRERNMLLNTLSLNGDEGLIVGELGAGHGRLAEIFGNTTNYRYYIFDITPALYVSQWYIKKIFPDEKIFEFRRFNSFDEISSELENCRFAFFTANQIEKMPKDMVQLFINMNSLTEMKLDQINNFLSQIDRLTTKAFLSRQWNKWDNLCDNISVSKGTFKMDNKWHLTLDKTDDIHPDFFNQIWVK